MWAEGAPSSDIVGGKGADSGGFGRWLHLLLHGIKVVLLEGDREETPPAEDDGSCGGVGVVMEVGLVQLLAEKMDKVFGRL